MSRITDPSPAAHSPAAEEDPDGLRRSLLGLPLALAGTALAPSAFAQYGNSSRADAAPPGGGTQRLALLVGNRVYPAPHDLPPVHKNVRDLAEALTQRGFKVTTAVDQEPAALKKIIDSFAREAVASPPDTTVLFYFTGHGMQVDAENLLLGAGLNPAANESTLVTSSLHFRRDVVDILPVRSQGLTITVIDACRTSLRAALKSSDGLNQVEAPLGCLITFSTGAGKPAISPSVETANTFYTASLVKVMEKATGETTFSDLFRLVKLDVQQIMLNHPIAAIRQVAQFPFIAENTRVRVRLTPGATGESQLPRFDNQDESTAWRELEECQWPADVVKLASAYLQRWPKSRLAGSAEVAREGASDAAKAMQRNDVRLFKSAFAPKPDLPTLQAELRKAARGDKDAAARIARMYRQGQDGVNNDINRYEGWAQFAAALGNGIASYELAVYYRGADQPQLAAQYETRARELGYTPPPTLDHVRK